MLKGQVKLAAIGLVAVLVFEAVGAYAFKANGAGVRWIGILGVLLYLAIGFFAGRRLGTWRDGLGVVMIVALVEMPLGMLMMHAVDPGSVPNLPVGMMIAGSLIGIVFNGIIGLIGTLIGARFARSDAPR
ncbi:MAG: hypothetical protein M3R30_00390 [Candidatus Eremiobacteraeota bacterium]|nr:hypothetical protein [Candidatus Eremiobacteraeota bacterium]